MQKSTNKLTPALVATVVVLVGLVSYIVADKVIKNNDQSTITGNLNTTTQQDNSSFSNDASSTDEIIDNSDTTQNTNSNTDSNSSVQSNTYVDGTYTATKSYIAPGNNNNGVTVRIKLQNDIVTSLDVSTSTSDRDSTEYASSFKSAVTSLVNNTDLDNISLSRVGGASLTTSAFNLALDQIKQQAQQ